MLGLVKKVRDTFISSDGRTDRQTPHDGIDGCRPRCAQRRATKILVKPSMHA